LDALQAQARHEFSRLRPLAERVEEEVAPTVERIGETFNGAFDTVLSGLDRVAEDEEASSGPGIGHFVFNRFGAGQPLDPFRIFGQARKQWWEGPNVCVDREVIDEDDQADEVKEDSADLRQRREDGHEGAEVLSSTGAFFAEMTMTSCKEGTSFRECTTRVNANGRRKTIVVTHRCCYSHRRTDDMAIGCQQVDIKDARETIADLEGDEFLQLVTAAGLDHILERNVTLFVPTNEAVEDFRSDLERLNSLEAVVELANAEDAGGPAYNVDEGLLSRKKRQEQPAVSTVVEAPKLEDLIGAHVVEGFLDSSQMHDEQLVETIGGKLRITIYKTYPEEIVMANCARVLSRDHHTSTGVVHAVDKVIVPATRSLADVIRSDVRFRSLAASLDATGLMDKLGESGQYTLFAPTDAAFARLDEVTRGRISAGGGCAADILKNHLLENVICSGVVESKAKTVNSLGKHVILDRTDEGDLTVEGVHVATTDVMTSNGVLHVVDNVIVPDAARNIGEALDASGAPSFGKLLSEAGIEAADLSNVTVFAPSERAMADVPSDLLRELRADPQKLREFLLYHVTTPKTCKCDFEDNKLLTSALEGQRIRLNLYQAMPLNVFDLRPRQFATAQCAKIVALEGELCGGIIHTVDKVLLPPNGDIVETLRNAGGFNKFLALIEKANLKDELMGDQHVTVLAPTDGAFEDADKSIFTEESLADEETAKRIVRRHVVGGSVVCCSGIPRQHPLMTARGRRTREGDVVSLRRSVAGHIYADLAEVTKCDMAATNGVVHAIDRVLVPEAMLPEGEEVSQYQQPQEAQSRRGGGILNLLKFF